MKRLGNFYTTLYVYHNNIHAATISRVANYLWNCIPHLLGIGNGLRTLKYCKRQKLAT